MDEARKAKLNAHRAWLAGIKPGDIVTRWLAGSIPMDLRVQSVDNGVIDCGWTFDQKTGAEIDDDLGWGPPPKMTGSYITEKVETNAGTAEQTQS